MNIKRRNWLNYFGIAVLKRHERTICMTRKWLVVLTCDSAAKRQTAKITIRNGPYNQHQIEYRSPSLRIHVAVDKGR